MPAPQGSNPKFRSKYGRTMGKAGKQPELAVVPFSLPLTMRSSFSCNQEDTQRQPLIAFSNGTVLNCYQHLMFYNVAHNDGRANQG